MSKYSEQNNSVSVKAKAYPIAEPKGKTLAFASVTIGDVFAVSGIRIMEGEKGLFAAMPSAKDKNGEYRDVCFPVTAEFRQELNNAILDAYDQALERPSVREQISEGAKIKKDTLEKEEKGSKRKPEQEL